MNTYHSFYYFTLKNYFIIEIVKNPLRAFILIQNKIFYKIQDQK